MISRKSTIVLFFFVIASEYSNSTEFDKNIFEWVDQKTEHKIVQVDRQPYSKLNYFTDNIFTADGKSLVYQTPRGVYIATIPEFRSTQVIKQLDKKIDVIGFGRKSRKLYYVIRSESQGQFRSIDVDTLKITEYAVLPKDYAIESINADESFAVGVAQKGVSTTKKNSGKADYIYTRFKESIPMSLFVVNLKNGKFHDIFKSDRWLSHAQFSPVDPDKILYSIEGPWHLVDRIWVINKDGSSNELIHKKNMEMEIAGHEVWSQDGKYIIYDWQYPKGKKLYIAMYDITKKTKSAFDITNLHCSVHYNISANGQFLVGDGEGESSEPCSKESKNIIKYSIKNIINKNENRNEISETVNLVDLIENNYSALEPNLRVSPDSRWVIFMSNMFGPSHVFAVSAEHAKPNGLKSLSTSAYAAYRRKLYQEITRVN